MEAPDASEAGRLEKALARFRDDAFARVDALAFAKRGGLSDLRGVDTTSPPPAIQAESEGSGADRTAAWLGPELIIDDERQLVNVLTGAGSVDHPGSELPARIPSRLEQPEEARTAAALPSSFWGRLWSPRWFGEH